MRVSAPRRRPLSNRIAGAILDVAPWASACGWAQLARLGAGHDLVGRGNPRPRVAHIGEGPIRVPGAPLPAPHGVVDHGDLESLAAGVDRRRADAIVGGQPAYIALVHAV